MLIIDYLQYDTREILAGSSGWRGIETSRVLSPKFPKQVFVIPTTAKWGGGTLPFQALPFLIRSLQSLQRGAYFPDTTLRPQEQLQRDLIVALADALRASQLTGVRSGCTFRSGTFAPKVQPANQRVAS